MGDHPVGVAVVAAAVFAAGLVTYEIVVLVMAAAGLLSGGVALVWLAVQARQLRELQEAQRRRIEQVGG